MVVHDFPVKRLSLEDLERRALDLRMRCEIAPGAIIDVQRLLFDEMPDYLKKLGLTLVARTAAHMGEREAYAAPKARRIFYRPALLARLKFSDPSASLIFLHELAHVILHRENGGAEKAWLKDENTKVSFVSVEESSEWQATMLALCFKAPACAAKEMANADDLGAKFGLGEKHAAQRFDAVRRRLPRKVPEIYKNVRSQLAAASKSGNMTSPSGLLTNVGLLCPGCGVENLIEISGRHYCDRCRSFGAKLQDGDTFELDFET